MCEWGSAKRQNTRFLGDRKLRQVTKRELQVVKLICDGKQTKEIAQLLGISHNTVRVHRRMIFVKLQLNSIALLVRWYLKRA